MNVRSLVPAAAAVLLLVTGGCGDASPKKGVHAKPVKTQLEKAYDACDIAAGTKIELADGNHSIIINGVTGDDDNFTDIVCLVSTLNTPQYIVSEIDNTTAMMGRQHEEDGGLTYEWSYHPDNGLDMVIHED